MATGYGYALQGYDYIPEVCTQPGLHRLVKEDKTLAALRLKAQETLLQSMLGDAKADALTPAWVEEAREALECLKLLQAKEMPTVAATTADSLVDIPSVTPKPAIDDVASEGYRHGAAWDTHGWQNSYIAIWRTGIFLLNETMKMQSFRLVNFTVPTADSPPPPPPLGPYDKAPPSSPPSFPPLPPSPRRRPPSFSAASTTMVLQRRTGPSPMTGSASAGKQTRR